MPLCLYSLLLVIWCTLGPSPALACSRIIFNNHRDAVYSARTMDWMFEFKTNIMFTPAGLHMDGGCGHHLPWADQCKTWTSKYWSVTTSINGWLSTKTSNFTETNFSYDSDGATDGINEMGLGAHLLYLGSTAYPEYKPVAAGVTYMRWLRYLLDTCATVAETKAAMLNTTVLGVGVDAALFGVHMALEDKSGDSVIFELVGGKLQQYPRASAGSNAGFGRDFRVMTNDPPLPLQIANRDRFMQILPNGSLSLDCEVIQPANEGFHDNGFPHRCLPGDITARARFVRLSYFLHYLNDTGKKPNEIAGEMRSILLSAAVPHGAPDTDPWDNGVYPTWWYTVTDYNQNLYYFGNYADINTVFVDLNNDMVKSVWSNSKTIRYLPAPGFPLSGDVTSKFSHKRPSTAPQTALGLVSQVGEHRNVIAGGVMLTCLASFAAFLSGFKLSTRKSSSTSVALLSQGLKS